MKKNIIISCALFSICSNYFSSNPHDGDPPLDLKTNITVKCNYNYFSNILVYPLSVSHKLNILNGGGASFKFFIYDENRKLVMSFDSSPYCSSTLVIDSFQSGTYTIKASNDSEVHQFIFVKE